MEICEPSKCTGCGTCVNACPQGAVRMLENEYGAVYPVVDEKRCTSCQVCRHACPAVNESAFVYPQKCYAAWSRDEQERQSCASGGAASAFARQMIALGGVVFGAAFTPGIHLVHNAAYDIPGIRRFKGSKYAKSDTGYCFREAQTLLESGRRVLYIGTPCQVDGLLHFLGKGYENLITVDIVCHGTPHGSFLREYLSHRVRRPQDITNVVFREGGDWRITAYEGDRMRFDRAAWLDEYYQCFLNGTIYAQACYGCKYAQNKRVSDITVGDFWGLGAEQHFPYSTDNVSLVLVNTDKGTAFLETCKALLCCVEREVSEAVGGNTQLRRPSEYTAEASAFQQRCKKDGFYRALRATETAKEVKRLRRIRFFHMLLKRALRRGGHVQ